jgi:hypothetical protein
MEMFTPIAAFADVANYAVNLDGVNVEALLRDVSGPLGSSVIGFPLMAAPGRQCPPLRSIARGLYADTYLD